MPAIREEQHHSTVRTRNPTPIACVSMPRSVEIASPVVAEISDDSLPPEPAPMRKPQGKFGPRCKYKTEAEMRAAQAAYDAVQELIARRKRVLARRRQSQKRARDPVRCRLPPVRSSSSVPTSTSSILILT